MSKSIKNLSERDHRKIAQKQELFFFHESAPGMPYWLPKGLIIKNLLIQYWRQYHLANGYQEISAPLLNRKVMWEVSGHAEHYQENMVSCSVHGDDEWAAKPMNCGNAMLVYRMRPRSYRELPLRLADVDLLHRDEPSGSLSGILRCRSFQQDDSHNFVAEDQIEEEINEIIKVIKSFYSIFGLLDNVKLYFSSRPDDYMGDLNLWDQAEGILLKILKESGIPFGVKEKDGAFYGPKIDIHLFDSLEREWQCGTVQLDFQLPRRFGLEYIAKDGSKKIPVVVHRVIYGSFERFIGILLEHFAGDWPFWIAPEQVRIIPLVDNVEYLAVVKDELSGIVLKEPVRYNELRFKEDLRNESLGWKIREAESLKIPLIIIIGRKEVENQQVSLRIGKQQQCLDLVQLGSCIESLVKLIV